MKDIAIVDPYPRTMELIFSKPKLNELKNKFKLCLLYTSPSPRDEVLSRMPSSA